ncbi:hypothetical protein SAMN04488540_101155 [Ferrimonas sediminum]|uniref:Uncharacterized protein n=1 Tax=Ferrimonas sediminum TaxID=718193 RepID=A0A1G8JTI2_9GAMM|nr:hypothetical protein SAMN04488540_101155 [Ferrimonas sediminum]
MRQPCLPHLYILIVGVFLALTPFVINAVLMLSDGLV